MSVKPFMLQDLFGGQTKEDDHSLDIKLILGLLKKTKGSFYHNYSRDKDIIDDIYYKIATRVKFNLGRASKSSNYYTSRFGYFCG